VKKKGESIQGQDFIQTGENPKRGKFSFDKKIPSLTGGGKERKQPEPGQPK